MDKETKRCGWCGNDELYVKYHDEEWGRQVRDDKVLFEFFILESAQAGLSWITILQKREGYRRNYSDFEVREVAHFDASKIELMMNDKGIVRNRAKIVSSVSNAQLFMQIQKEYGSFYNYLYHFMPNQSPIKNTPKNYKLAPTSSIQSDAIASDLKKRGAKFFGSTICYAFMQAVGMVNDHEQDCSFV